MFYTAFLLYWLPLPEGAPPVTPPRAAFIQRFDTYKECMEFKSRVKDPDVKKQTSCVLMVVEPKEGIKE